MVTASVGLLRKAGPLTDNSAESLPGIFIPDPHVPLTPQKEE